MFRWPGASPRGAGSALAQLPAEQRREEVLKSIRSAASGMGLEPRPTASFMFVHVQIDRQMDR